MPSAAASPQQIAYDDQEIRADAAVHAVGIVAVLAGVAYLTTNLNLHSPEMVAGVAIYMLSLVASFCVSAAYNLWPRTPTKWLLRRLDHSTIYLFIAGTYTPFIIRAGGEAWILFAVVWISAAIGIFIKICRPGRYEALSVGSYPVLGWSGAALYGSFAAAFSPSVLMMIGIGGLAFTIGVIFYAWQGLKYQNAIWHCFVLAGAICHYDAVLNAFTFA